VMVLSAAVFVGLIAAQTAVTPRGLRRTRVVEGQPRKEML
jgi:hypothetical protein